MKKILLVICCSALIFTFINNNASAAEVVIKGSSQFDCSLSAKYMEKHGYVFIEETAYASYVTTNMYAAAGSEVSVLDEDGNVLGTAKVDNKGSFSVTVPKEDTYKIICKFHDKKVEKIVKYSKIDNVTIYNGFVKSEVVDHWLQAAVSNECITC
jgi:hypothetical protein